MKLKSLFVVISVFSSSFVPSAFSQRNLSCEEQYNQDVNRCRLEADRVKDACWAAYISCADTCGYLGILCEQQCARDSLACHEGAESNKIGCERIARGQRYRCVSDALKRMNEVIFSSDIHNVE
jgi:hypothetical protein